MPYIIDSPGVFQIWKWAESTRTWTVIKTFDKDTTLISKYQWIQMLSEDNPKELFMLSTKNPNI